MKKILLGLSLTLALSSNALAENIVTPEMVQKVIDTPNISKEQVYTQARQWVATTFASANQVIQMDDKESGTIIGKGNFKYPCEGFWNCNAFGKDLIKFTLKIDIKDEKARVTFSDLTSFSSLNLDIGLPEFSLPLANVKKQQYKDRSVVHIEELIDDLQKSIIRGQSNDDW